jgi:hypothetical protein
MICPFCRETDIGNKSGQTVCPACKAGFEIDDRGECIFADVDRIRIPVDGQVCMVCGLVQDGKWGSCVWCGADFNKTIH